MRIIIPTRNRPTSLAGVLRYYETFYSESEIILADGSDDAFKEMNQQLVANTPLKIDYRPYSADVSLFDRLLLVLKDESDPFYIMAADDDYPIMETMAVAKRRLENNPEAVCAAGFLVHISLLDADNATTRLDPVRPLTGPTAARRMWSFGQFPFTTTYGVARRSRLIARYEFLKNWNLPGFFDLGVGLMDAADGKFLAIPELGFICTRNTVHSYYRAEEPLVYLRRSDEVMQLYETLSHRLQEVDGIDEETARTHVSRIISAKVAALSGAPPFRIAGFTEHQVYANPHSTLVRGVFADIFSKDTEQRQKFEPKLAFIAENLKSTVSSNDNAGDKAKYESF